MYRNCCQRAKIQLAVCHGYHFCFFALKITTGAQCTFMLRYTIDENHSVQEREQFNKQYAR